MSPNQIEPGRLTGENLRTFILAGNATFTAKSLRTSKHFTYKLSQRLTQLGELTPFFVEVLTGSDNETDFKYFGTIFLDRMNFVFNKKKSAISENAPSVRAFAFIWPLFMSDKLPAYIEIWHEGRCGCCGRKLTTPESLETGIGPRCAANMRKMQEEAQLEESAGA